MSISGGRRFEVGATVEVAISDALFPAKIIGENSHGGVFTVEYESLMEKTPLANGRSRKRRPLKEEVEATALRPPPPSEGECLVYDLGDEVDAFHCGSWREGLVVQAMGGGDDGSRLFAVHLRALNRRFVFESEELRIHREWVRGRWVPPPSGERNILQPLNNERKKSQKGEVFSKGSLVEVSSDEDGFRGSWYTATILKSTGKNKYLVKYKSLRREGNKKFVKQEFDAEQIRPYPPESLVVDSFDLNEKVDAFYNDGWWEGSVSKVLKNGRYKIYFGENYGQYLNMVFEHCDLRPHQDWIGGTWVMAGSR